MKKCILCGKNAKAKKVSICIICKKDPFKVEEYRKVLAKKRKIEILRGTYSKSFAEVVNLNTAKFWDTKLRKLQSYDVQDGMTRDRVKTAATFISANSKNILDIGVGHGFLEEILPKYKREISFYGIDITPKGIDLIKKKFKGVFTVGSIYDIKYPSEFFDVVVALEVLEHIPPHKIFKAYSNIYKVLSRKGTLIVSVPLNEGLQSLKINPSGHMREYSQELIIKELLIAGFKTIEYKYFFAFKKFYKYKKVIQKILRHRWQPNNIVIKAIKI